MPCIMAVNQGGDMKNKTFGINEPARIRDLEWLYLETQGDDFLLGKTPNNLEYSWEDEE
jgi:hypothetical protein